MCGLTCFEVNRKVLPSYLLSQNFFTTNPFAQTINVSHLLLGCKGSQKTKRLLLKVKFKGHWSKGETERLKIDLWLPIDKNPMD